MTSVKIRQTRKQIPDCFDQENETTKYPQMEVGPLSEDAIQFASADIRETPENVKKGLEELKELLANDLELHFDTSDDFLFIFLRPCKFYAKSAYALMKRIAEFKRKYHIFEDLLPVDVLHLLLKYNLVGFLEQRDHKDRRVLIQNLGASWDVTQVTSDELLKILYLLSELAVIEQETQVRGCVIIMDYHGLTLKHITAMSASTCKKLMQLIQDALPVRVKEVHVVRQPSYFKVVWAVMKPFIGEKMKKRLFFHGYKMNSLHKFIPPTHLPKDYGGDLPPLTHQGKVWNHLFTTHLEHMKKMNECGFLKKC